MSSDERNDDSGAPPAHIPGSPSGGPEETIGTRSVQIERKTFVFALKDNPRGRFLRITEDVGRRRDTIIIPASGLEAFRKILDEVIRQAAETPTKSP